MHWKRRGLTPAVAESSNPICGHFPEMGFYLVLGYPIGNMWSLVLFSLAELSEPGPYEDNLLKLTETKVSLPL